MSFTLTSPVTGAAQTGFTSPTYTIAADTAPTSAGKQYAVTGIGGTQTGVDTTSSPSKPFTVTLSRPQVLRVLSAVDPVTGALRSVPRNSYVIRTRKGVTPLAGQASVPYQIVTQCDVPAGADSYDAPNCRAALSFHIGVLNQNPASYGDTTVTGVI